MPTCSYAVPQLWPLYHVYLCCYLNLAHFSVSQDKQVSIVSSAVNRGQHCLKKGDAFTKTWTSVGSMSAQGCPTLTRWADIEPTLDTADNVELRQA